MELQLGELLVYPILSIAIVKMGYKQERKRLLKRLARIRKLNRELEDHVLDEIRKLTLKREKEHDKKRKERNEDSTHE
jgi:hypothetical protein